MAGNTNEIFLFKKTTFFFFFFACKRNLGVQARILNYCSDEAKDNTLASFSLYKLDLFSSLNALHLKAHNIARRIKPLKRIVSFQIHPGNRTTSALFFHLLH